MGFALLKKMRRLAGLLCLAPLAAAAWAAAPDPGDLLELGKLEGTRFNTLVSDFRVKMTKDLGPRAEEFKHFSPLAVYAQLFAEHVTETVPSRTIKYASVDARQRPRIYSGRVFLPYHKPDTPPLALPLVVYQHGTETRRTATPFYNKGDETVLGALAASIGKFAVAMPDGDGMGADPSGAMHAYCNGATGAPCLIDCLRASLGETADGDGIFDTKDYVWDKRIFIVGYSEGGYIAMAALKELCTNPAYRDIQLTGAACLGGPFNFYQFTKTLLTDDSTPYTRPYIPLYFLAAWATLFPQDVSFKDSLDPVHLRPEAETVRGWFSGVLGGDQITPKIQAKMTQDPNKAVTVSSLTNAAWVKDYVLNPQSRVNALLKANDLVGGWLLPPTIPLLLAHSPQDEVVAYANSKASYDDLYSHGCKPFKILDLAINGKGPGHVGGALLGIPAAFMWIGAGMPSSIGTMAKEQLRQAFVAAVPKGLEQNADALFTAVAGDRHEDQALLPLSLILPSSSYKVVFNDMFKVLGKVKFYTVSKTPCFPGQKLDPALGGYTQLFKEMRKKGDACTLEANRPYYMAVYPEKLFVALTLKFSGGDARNGRFQDYTINIKQAIKNKVFSMNPAPYLTLSDNLKPLVHAESFENPKVSNPPFITLPH